ncbi:helix-turn-helix domain-containing protein [Paenibacillus thalictri]|uniref:AraC family transcriptional regulator n=1 Tax=Paenibacillus thalictri TaxID=2527873 RepID=A0A4Q9DMF2_9BACL|nr:helix-turn-helix domain-containing protein [Paenibacillus thalictri]TBL76492.1 AraC family transcriptional regulator [Paenibacillus thalictri]
MKSYLSRLIWLGCLSVCLPLVLAGIVYYNTSMKREIAHIQTNNQDSLGIVQRFIDDAMFGVVEELSKSALEPFIYESFLPLEDTRRVNNNISILKEVSALLNRSKFMKNVYYFNSNSKLILSSAQGNVHESYFKYRDDLQVIGGIRKSTYWKYLPASQKDGYISLIMTLPTTSPNPQGALVAQVEVEKINEYLSTILPLTRNESIFVLNKSGQVLFQSNDQSRSDKRVIDPVVQTIAASQQLSNNASMTDDSGNEYFYSFRKSSLGMTYVSVIPRDEMVKDLRWILWATIAAVAIFLAMGIFLTIYNSRRVYHPIGELVDYGKKLSKDKVGAHREETSYIRECLDYFNHQLQVSNKWIAQSEPSLIEKFMQQLLEGDYMSSQLLQEGCREFGIQADRTYIVLLVRIEDFGKTGRFQPKDKPLLIYALTNVMNELLASSSQKGYVIHDFRGYGVAVLSFDSAALPDFVICATRTYAEKVQSALYTYLNIRASMGIGRSYPHIADIALSYREAQVALQTRLLKESESILQIDDNTEKQPFPKYPHAIETIITEALIDGDAARFEQGVRDFNRCVQKTESYYFVYQSYHVLLAALVSSAEKKCGTALGILEYDLFDQLRTYQTSEEICLWFIDVVMPLYMKVMRENNNSLGKTAVKEVCKYIADNLDKDISLTECAAMFDINASYLSRIFKKETNESFHTYLSNCKLNEAARLLVDSDETISQIAAMIGYSHRTFNRVFQRLYGTSPSDYRKVHR